MAIADTIIELCSMAGPAGYEQAVAARVREMLSACMDEVRTDVLGNIIGIKRCGRENAKKLLFDAHIDEIGFIITGWDEGFLRFSALGGVDSRMLPASEIKILTEPPIVGIVGVLPPHILKADESDKTIKIEDLYIDVGLTQDEAKKAVPLGTAAVYNTGARLFGDGLICGKALDDRACFAGVLRALELLKDQKLEVDIYVLASVQEEVGERGARAGAFGIAPDWCVAIDVDHAKTPDSKEPGMKELGGGVIISKGTILNKPLTETAVKLAEVKDIKYQIGIEAGDTGTNANYIQISREGVATALFGLPLKYMHTPVEVISLADAEAAALLLAEVAMAMKGDDLHA
jgi:putative aminopeptidase FrvX